MNCPLNHSLLYTILTIPSRFKKITRSIVFLLFFLAAAKKGFSVESGFICYEIYDFGYSNSIIISNNGWMRQIPLGIAKEIPNVELLTHQDSASIADIFVDLDYKKLGRIYSCKEINCKEDDFVEKFVFITNEGANTIYLDNGSTQKIPEKFIKIQLLVRRLELRFRNKNQGIKSN